MEEYLPKDYKPKKLNVESLLTKALNNDNNENIMKLDKKLITKYKNEILEEIGITKTKKTEFIKKLKNYRYIADMADLNYGGFIRWINLKKIDNLKITNGGMLLDIKFYNSGVILMCKNNRNQVFTLKFDECLIFQKLTEQEELLLDVIEYIQ